MDENNAQRPAEPSGGWQFRPGDTAGSSRDAARGASTDTVSQNSEAADTRPFAMLHPDEYAPALAQTPMTTPDEAISWTASEFIAHQKSVAWYGILTLGTLVLAAVVFLLTKDKISTTVVLVAGIVFGVYAGRKPRTLGYRVDRTGLTVGQKSYAYSQFRSFAVLTEGAFSSIVFVPLRRFMPPLTIYYDPKDEQKIVDVLSDRLPMENHQLDTIDQLMRRVRF